MAAHTQMIRNYVGLGWVCSVSPYSDIPTPLITPSHTFCVAAQHFNVNISKLPFQSNLGLFTSRLSGFCSHIIISFSLAFNNFDEWVMFWCHHSGHPPQILSWSSGPDTLSTCQTNITHFTLSVNVSIFIFSFDKNSSQYSVSNHTPFILYSGCIDLRWFYVTSGMSPQRAASSSILCDVAPSLSFQWSLASTWFPH